MNDHEARTLWCGNLSDKVTEELLYELFLQAAPLEEVRIPTDKTGRRANYAFVVVKHEVSVDYVVQLLDGTRLYDRAITIKPRKQKSQPRQPPHQDFDELLTMGSMLNRPFNASSPPYQPHRQQHHNKPYFRRDNFSGRQNWNSRSHGNHGDRHRRRYH